MKISEKRLYKMRALRQSGRTFDSIDDELGQPRGTAYQAMRPSRAASANHASVSELKIDANGVLAERARRIEAAGRRTLSQTIFNDPPPGYSALDQRRSQ